MNIDQLLDKFSSPSRREFLKTSGRLVVSFTAASNLELLALSSKPGAQSLTPGPYPDPDYKQLDSWIVIHQDNTATFYVGKTDLGQGTGTAFRQIMSDELDFDFARTTCIMGTTNITVDQGGSGGSDALQTDGYPMRRVAAEARRVLLDMASQRLGVPAGQLSVSDSVVTVTADPSRRVTYGELIGGNRFNIALTGDNINQTTGIAKMKSVRDMKNVGVSHRRDDIPSKVDASPVWAVGVKVPGMVHARNVKPPMAGAECVSVDESSVSGMPGFIRVVRERNYIAVVCEREEQAIAAARRLKVNWSKPGTAPFPSSDKLFDYMRAAKPTSSPAPQVNGDVEAGLRSAVTRIEAEYEVPFQGHTSIGPAHALADPSNGQMTIYSNDMKSYGLRNGVAQFLKIPRENVRVVWMQGPQVYGRTAADDAGFEAAFLAQQIERPVRVQWMRDEETAWDTKGPAYVMKMRGGLDAQGNLVALDYEALAADYGHLGYNEFDTVLIAQLTGRRRQTPAAGGYDWPDDMYAVPNRRSAGHVVSLPLVWESPLRTGNLRDPNGPQVTFAGECFIDELAAAAKEDPVEFRLRLLSGVRRAGSASVRRAGPAPASEQADPPLPDDANFKRARSIAVVKAAADKFGWTPRPSPVPRATGDVATGRGFAYTYRNQTIVANAVEVDVNRRTGRVWVKRIVCSHDCGLVINPEALRGTIEGALLHGLSRALHEEVTFDAEKVTTVDWRTSPTLTHADTPAQIDIVLVNGDPNPNRPDLQHYGAGEAALKPMLAAVANAIYDATGVRMRRAPFRPARVLAALKA